MAVFETPEEKRIRERAEQKQAEYEKSTGEKVPEEGGIEPDQITEDAVSILAGGPMASMGKRVFRAAAQGAGKSALSKLKEKGPPPPGNKSIGGMGYSEGKAPPTGAGTADSPYRKYQPMKLTQATTGWEPVKGKK